MNFLLLLEYVFIAYGMAATEPNYYGIDELISEWEDTNEFWRATELLGLVRRHLVATRRRLCERDKYAKVGVTPPARRPVRPVCRGRLDEQSCPQCPRYTNSTTCELFRDSCRERRVAQEERSSYCDKKYGKWRSTLLPADYKLCRCCDECVFYREMHQHCEPKADINSQSEQFLNEIDLRAGCNPYLGHPDAQAKGLLCDPVLEVCLPVASATSLRRAGAPACQGRGEIATAECRLDRLEAASRRQLYEEPCKAEMRRLKELHGPDGHLHHSAPQCTSLGLYGPVQCRGWLCYCALEDGSRIRGVKVPRSQASTMYCDCALDKCRTNSTAQCDGFGNYLSPLQPSQQELTI